MYVRSKIIFHKKIFGENKYDLYFFFSNVAAQLDQ